MMKLAAVLISLSTLMFACSHTQRIQKTREVISKVDTSGIAIEKEGAPIDSARVITEVYNKVIKNKIDFTTFNAKVRVAYDAKDGGDEATAYIRLKKDSAMWLSLRGPLGIEGFRVLITQDSVTVMDLLKKNVQYRSIGYLQEITRLPVDFLILQDLVIGNPVFIDSNIISYSVNSNNELLILMNGKFFKHLVSIDNTNYKILHSRLDDIDVGRSRSCEITMGDYENTVGVPFSKKREISVAEQSKLKIDLDFKQYSFNQPVTFPFSIPKSFKRL